MALYNNIFASSYRFYSRFKGEAPWGTSIILVCISQFSTVFLVFAILKKITGINALLALSAFLPSKYFYIPIFAIWGFVLYRYYSKEKTTIILADFEKKSANTKVFWGYFTILWLVLPVLLTAILLRKS
jgi:hypothetical protein